MALDRRESRTFHFNGWTVNVDPDGNMNWRSRPVKEEEENSHAWFVFDEAAKFTGEMPNIPWMPREKGLVIDITAEIVEDERKTAQEAPLLIERSSKKKGRKRNRRDKSDGIRHGGG